MYHLPQTSWQYSAVKSARQAILLLFYTCLDASLLSSDLYQIIPH